MAKESAAFRSPWLSAYRSFPSPRVTLFLMVVLAAASVGSAQGGENASDLPSWTEPSSTTDSPRPVPETRPRPQCPWPFAWIPDPSDCRLFWRCNWGTALLMPECPQGTVFSRRFRVCVHVGSVFDDCSSEARHNNTTDYPSTPSSSSSSPDSTTTRPPFVVDDESVFEFCALYPRGVSAHHKECQLFYNCSLHYGLPVPRRYQFYLQECPSPLLYDYKSEACRDRWQVDCRGRKIPATECDYRNNSCITTSESPREVTSSSASPSTTTSPFNIYEVCARNQSAVWAHGAECQLYYNCFSPYNVVPTSLEQYLHECPYPLLFDRHSHVCQDRSRVDCQGTRVPATRCDYRINDCYTNTNTTPSEFSTTTSQPEFNIYEVCARNQSAVWAHGAECQLYYNCSSPYNVVPTSLEQYLHECPYPLLFDRYSHVCQDRSRVDCLGARVPATRCDYRINDCYTNTNTTPPEFSTTTSQPEFNIYEVCARNQSAVWAHGAECQLYYNCSSPYNVVPTSLEQYLHECPYPLLFDRHSHVCQDRSRVDCLGTRVPATRCDYRINDCYTNTDTTPSEFSTTTSQPEFNIYEVCARNQSAVWAHGAECQLYYNCSSSYNVVPTSLEQYLHECPYPLLFDRHSHVCQDRSRVDCQGTRVPTTRCDYRLPSCDGASCLLCGDCTGREDGLYAASEEGAWGHTYVTCKGGYSVATARCIHDNLLDIPRFFSPLNKTCVNVYQIPGQYGGLRPDCAGRSDGRYPDQNNRRDLFTVCQNGSFVGVYRCPGDNPVFNAQTELCTM